MNIDIITGNITSIWDNSTNVKVTVADNYKETTTFIPSTFFSESTCNFIRQFMKVGDHISIKGRIGSYKDNNGKEVISVIGNEINFEGYKNPKKTNSNESAAENKNVADDFYEMKNENLTEDDLPF